MRKRKNKSDHVEKLKDSICYSPSRNITREELVSDMDDIFREYDLVFREMVGK